MILDFKTFRIAYHIYDFGLLNEMLESAIVSASKLPKPPPSQYYLVINLQRFIFGLVELKIAAKTILHYFYPMLETKTDQQRPDLDKLIDSFVEIIRSMLINSETPYTLHKKILETFQQDNAEIAIKHVRGLLHMTDSTVKVHWGFETEFREARLSSEEKKLFTNRVHSILLDQQQPLTEHSYQYWEKMKLSDQQKLYNSLHSDTNQNIRILIDGNWELFDLTSFAHKISTAYELFLNLYILENYQVVYGRQEFAALFGDYFHPSDFGNMQISQMKYASPGHFDLLGIGKVLEQLVMLINKIVHWKREYKLSKLENTKKQLDLLVEMNIDLDKLGLDVHTKEQSKIRLSGAAKELFDWLEPEQITGANLGSAEQRIASRDQQLN